MDHVYVSELCFCESDVISINQFPSSPHPQVPPHQSAGKNENKTEKQNKHKRIVVLLAFGE